jgi:hypothetical protein
MAELEKLIKDQEQITENLKNALEYEKHMNQQLMGRLDTYQSIMERLWRLLIDKATERR